MSALNTYIIVPVEDLDEEIWAKVVEGEDPDHIRKSNDGTLTVLKYPYDMDPLDMTLPYDKYTYAEILEVMASEDWVTESPI